MSGIKRKCYILTIDSESDRYLFCKGVLENVGFSVNPFIAITHNNKILSNKLSMVEIYKLVAKGDDEWVYVFEDDINVLENISIDEIIEYEKISNKIFYLGACFYNNRRYITNNKVNNHDVYVIDGNVRGLHAIGLSKVGADKLLNFIERYDDFECMDMILEKFVEIYTANIVRYDLESYIYGHRGIFFQDRNKFKSLISS